MLDLDDVDEMFRVLHRWGSSLPGYPAHLIDKCLGAGEWAFPLACIVNACVENKSVMPKDLFVMFRELVNILGLGSDSEYKEIGEFINSQCANSNNN